MRKQDLLSKVLVKQIEYDTHNQLSSRARVTRGWWWNSYSYICQPERRLREVMEDLYERFFFDHDA